MKYSRQQNQRFERKESGFALHYYDNMICVSFDKMTGRVAAEIGEELVGQLVCRSFEVDKDKYTDLWLVEVDYAILNGFGTEDGLISLLKDICDIHGYEVEYLQNT